MDDLTFQSAKSLARAIREKSVSAREVVEAHLRRIEEVNPVLNAVVQLAAERAESEARELDDALARGELRGPLHGVPITIKDSFDTEGIISTGGTLGRAAFVPERDATPVARLRAAGAVLLGKTNTPELTMAAETDNLVYGRTNNPFDVSRTPGGSSGGAAAIISAGGSPLDLGTDTGGSIRFPSHYCGIAGLKPTSGRVPRTGHIIGYDMGAAQSLTVVGPMARYVEDLELAFPIIAGPDYRDPHMVPMPIGDPGDVDLAGLRVAYYTESPGASASPETARAVRDAAAALADAGATTAEEAPAALADRRGADAVVHRLRQLGLGRPAARAFRDDAGARLDNDVEGDGETAGHGRLHGAAGGDRPLQVRDDRVHGDARPDSVSHLGAAGAAARGVLRRGAHARSGLFGGVQRDGLAGGDSAGGHVAGGSADRGADGGASVA